MADGRIERKLLFGFGLALVVLLANALLSTWNVRALVLNSRRVEHTREVLGILDEIQVALLEAEAGQRGFLLSGDARHVETYRDAIQRSRERVDRFQTLTADNPSQQSRAEEIGRVVEDRIAILTRVLELRAEPPRLNDDVARALDRGREAMDQVRLAIEAGEIEEERLLVRRDWESRLALYQTIGTIAVATLLAAILLGSSYLQLRRHILDRNRAEEEILALNRDLELRVEERTAELQRSNRDLEAFTTKLQWSNRELQEFASVASHDLQEPLRKIQAFGDRLRAKCAGGLGEQGIDYLGRMQAAAARMSTLINDLLAFSRVTSKAQPFATVDLARVAREVVVDLEGRIQQTGGRVEFNGLPSIDADPLQMRQLLQNLIGNALKFHRPGEPPVVTIRSRLLDPTVPNGAEDSEVVAEAVSKAEASTETGPAPAAPTCEIEVSDNGIGFEEKYLDRIFNVFQRLHGRGEYEGTGMGLAICRKIVERHVGTITARSEPDRGSTFIITLPTIQVQPEDAP